jgi:hypothetical protein
VVADEPSAASPATGRAGRGDAPAAAAAPARQASFTDYADPFATGWADSQPIEQVVAYSFAALQAWANDHQLSRQLDETALEFANRLGQAHPPLQAVVRELAVLSSRAAFAPTRLDDADLDVLRRFWHELGSYAAPDRGQPVGGQPVGRIIRRAGETCCRRLVLIHLSENWCLLLPSMKLPSWSIQECCVDC